MPVDQTVAPTADFVEGTSSFDRFQDLGTVTVAGSQLIIELNSARQRTVHRGRHSYRKNYAAASVGFAGEKRQG